MNDDARRVLLAPLLVWAGMIALLAASLGYAFLHGAPAKLAVNLLVAAGQVALIATVFMQLTRANALVRLTAAAGVAWLSLLFLFSFADFLTR